MSAETAVELRRLPFVLRPRPNEPFDSWLEAMAGAHKTSLLRMARGIGLIDEAVDARSPVNRKRAFSWTLSLSDDQALRIQKTTGIPTKRVQAMTRAGHTRGLVGDDTAWPIGSGFPVRVTGSSYCPDCLRESGGRWQSQWQYAFVFGCVQHRLLLVETCPLCGRQPRQRVHALSGTPMPGHCHHPVLGSTKGRDKPRCGADLSAHPDRVALPDSAAQAQQAILNAVERGTAAFGIYGNDPQDATRMLADLRLLTLTTRMSPDRGALRAVALTSEIADRYLRSAVERPKEKGAAERHIRDAVEVTFAYEALNDINRVKQCIADRPSVKFAADTVSPQIRAILRSTHLRDDRPGIAPATAELAANSTLTRRTQMLPTLLWDEVVDKFAQPCSLDPEILAITMAASVIVAGTSEPYSAGLALLGRPRSAVDQAAYALRRVRMRGRAEELRAVTLELANYLDVTPAPIDYVRRRGLDCGDLLPLTQWRALCISIDLDPCGNKAWVMARTLLYRRLTGNPTRLDKLPWDDPYGMTRHAVSAFNSRLPAALSDELEKAGIEFLRERRIDEPLEWKPSPVADWSLHRPTETSGAKERKVWPTVRSSQTKAQRSTYAEQYRAGLSMDHIARRENVARSSVLSALKKEGILPRQAGRQRIAVDADILRQRYKRELKTIQQIATEFGCSVSVVNQNLRRAGITVRPRGGRSHARALHANSIISGSPLLERAFSGEAGRLRAERFLVVASHATITEAARSIGVPASSLSVQMSGVASRVGGAIINPAERGRPLTLTPLGQQLAAELRAAPHFG